MIITGKYPALRLRRNRKTDWSRRLISENKLSTDDLILPIFLTEGKNKKIPIKTMPNVFRYSIASGIICSLVTNIFLRANFNLVPASRT